MDYNILYEVPDVIDYYVLAVGQNCYVYKNLTVVHDINIARKFLTISGAHRYARKIGITGYRLIGVKNYTEEETRIQKLVFIKPRASRGVLKPRAAEEGAAGETVAEEASAEDALSVT
ncbi:MAG: hypothetical protein LBL98_09100 [Ruminococcus sp.]|jgi:hypothetical protein|nr:hypothetical protein [Ruminococcus sp.]